MAINHQNNFATNATSAISAAATTSPLNDIPSVDANFYLAFDATNINSHYEVVEVTSKTATNVNHAALTYDHTTDEEVRMVIPAEEMDEVVKGPASAGDADIPLFDGTTGKVLKASGYQIRYGTSVGTTDVNGGLSVSFSTAFPNSTTAVILSNGDESIGNLNMSIAGTPSASSFVAKVRTADTGANFASTAVRVNYIAIGT